KKYKVGLCLSGGGTRGFSYLGVFKAFEEYGIEFDMVAGTSAGSLFGAIYASKMDLNHIKDVVKNLKNKDFRQSKLGILPSSMDKLQELLSQVLPIKKAEELKVQYFAVAVDLKTGKEIHFNSGDLPKIITGSCSIPGVFLPVKYKNMTLIDGGVRNNIPADVLKMNGCDFVVTIDCNCTRGGGTNSEKLFTQFSTSVGIMMVNNSKQGTELSDIIICPDLKKYKSLSLEGKEEMIKEGYRATVEMMPEIQNLFLGKLKKR
ncbi:MAG: patatin-like phospholipase family protein, partial [Clostridia bacterium]|nr:patatin-like phospholipase family protein [Clostridia bacterium]